MDRRLSHLIKLAQRTGDRLIVLPDGKEQPFVLLSVQQYEQLLAGDLGEKPNSKDATSVPIDSYEFEPVAYDDPRSPARG